MHQTQTRLLGREPDELAFESQTILHQSKIPYMRHTGPCGLEATVRPCNKWDMSSDDSVLLERWRAGHQRAGEQLFQRYYHAVERFFINKLSIVEVGDMVQETFKACVERRHAIRANKFRAYLFATAHYILCDYLRREYRNGRPIDIERLSMHDLSATPSAVVTQKREQRLLLEALRQIPLHFQIVLELHYWEEMSTSEIGELLSMPAGTVRSRMRRARELLDQTMARIAESVELLESTKSKFDDWAKSCVEILNQGTPQV